MNSGNQKKGSFLNLAALGNASWSAGDNPSPFNFSLSIDDLQTAAEDDDISVGTNDNDHQQGQQATQPYRYSAVGSTPSSPPSSPQNVPPTETALPPPELLTAEEAARSVISNELQWLKLRCSIERSGFVTSAGLQQMLPQLVQDRLDDMNEREAELLREQAKRMAVLNADTQRTTPTVPISPEVANDAPVSTLPPKTLGVSMLSPGAKRKHKSAHHSSFSGDIRKGGPRQSRAPSMRVVADQRKKQLAMDLKASLTPPPRQRLSVAEGLLAERAVPATCGPGMRPRARLTDDASSNSHSHGTVTGNRSRLGSAASAALASLAPGLTPQRRWNDKNYPEPSPSVFGASQSSGGIDWASAIGPPPLSSARSGGSFAALDISRHDLLLGGLSGDVNSSVRDTLPTAKGESAEDNNNGSSFSSLRLSLLPTL